MGDWLAWLVLGSLIFVMFCIYSLSGQVDRCVRLSEEIITGNQRKILERLDALADARAATTAAANVVPFERRFGQRRRGAVQNADKADDDRRRSPGRRRDDRHGAQPRQ